ncbi:MAG: hypothetical protein H0T84_13520 [Tatlockia sp.]|nr:hypothetical protein [Tatlockia sp.]
MTKQGGISLIEIVISLFTATLVMTLIMQHYLQAKRQYIRMQSLLEQTIEVQMVSDMIRGSVRRGGFTPCRGLSSLQSIDRRNGKTGLLPVESGSEKEKSLTINRMNEHFGTVIRQLNPKQLLVKANIQYEKQQSILIADCYSAEVQVILEAKKTLTGAILTLKNTLKFSYKTPVYIGEWIEEKFFIQKNKQGLSSLFYKGNHVDELSNLVNSLSVELKSSQGKTLVEVGLGSEFLPTTTIVTEVRAG